mmetsp:Transcript_26529/g.68484  ORF Transcript_26529/g.68484 Transcript_26529/m.68484 type:complete len:218 (-) Transcript_26529:291-944(-)
MGEGSLRAASAMPRATSDILRPSSTTCVPNSWPNPRESAATSTPSLAAAPSLGAGPKSASMPAVAAAPSCHIFMPCSIACFTSAACGPPCDTWSIIARAWSMVSFHLAGSFTASARPGTDAAICLNMGCFRSCWRDSSSFFGSERASSTSFWFAPPNMSIMPPAPPRPGGAPPAPPAPAGSVSSSSSPRSTSSPSSCRAATRDSAATERPRTCVTVI